MLATTDILAACRVDVCAAGGVGELAAVLAARGFAVFDGLTDEQVLLQLAGRLGQVVRHRDSDAAGITVITNLGGTVTRPGQAGFTDQALAPHTDGSDQPQPPGLVVMACAQPGRGGECVVADGQAVYADLAATAPDALVDLTSARGAYFGGAAGYAGSVFEPHPDGHLSLRLRLDELARFSPRVQRWLPVLRQAINRHAVTFRLAAGAGYVLNNRRFLHARRAFTGQRVMCRVHVEPRPAWRIPAGFEPTGGAR